MIAVLIPALNASQTLSEVLKKVSEHVPSSSVIVVDDGSTDETARIAQAGGARLLSHPVNRGKGAALRTGFEHVVADPAIECVITLDADLQHDPNELPKFIEQWKQGNADVIIGRRKRIGSGMPLHRRMSNIINSYLVSVRGGARIYDSQCGYRCIGRSVLETIQFSSDGFEAETEILLKAARLGFRFSSVRISTIYGSEQSHMTHWQTTRRFLHVLMKEY
jgi:glycosyltransferase involved in cell wall biosynthesis